MQLMTLLLASIAALASAQTATSSAMSSTTSSSCAAQNILDACKSTIQGQINTCATNDYSCLCTNYQNLLICYNNCPMDSGVGTAQQLRQQNCVAASAYGSTTILGTASVTSGAMSATGTYSSSMTAVQSGFASGSNTASGVSASSTHASGAGDVKAAGGILALVAGVAALL
ncbi:hypothetical protein LTR66_017173 [Elasticomyces elasticus]|nr:hypothetical protein LTR66_017173 [Elasticomyces elasticus]